MESDTFGQKVIIWTTQSDRLYPALFYKLWIQLSDVHSFRLIFVRLTSIVNSAREKQQVIKAIVTQVIWAQYLIVNNKW